MNKYERMSLELNYIRNDEDLKSEFLNWINENITLNKQFNQIEWI